jgi:hypothetical protein
MAGAPVADASATKQPAEQSGLQTCQLSAESWMHRAGAEALTENRADSLKIEAVTSEVERPSELHLLATGTAEELKPTIVPPAVVHRRSSMATVSLRAREHIRYGFDLSERGAVYLARETLVQALRLVAEALDADDQTEAHCVALDAGLKALREADDFAPASEQGAAGVDLRLVSAAHRTPVLKNQDVSRMTPLAALQSYHAYALEQLTWAGGHEPLASMALYGLARIEAVEKDSRHTMGGPKAIALYQAALAVDPQNAQAANELGVLYARYGQLQRAKALFLQSVSIQAQPGSCRNLSLVCQQLGEEENAKAAWSQHESLLATPDDRQRYQTGSLMRWVDPETLAQSAPADSDVMTSPSAQAKGTSIPGASSVAKSESWFSPFGRWSIFKKKSEDDQSVSNP